MPEELRSCEVLLRIDVHHSRLSMLLLPRPPRPDGVFGSALDPEAVSSLDIFGRSSHDYRSSVHSLLKGR